MVNNGKLYVFALAPYNIFYFTQNELIEIQMK